MTKGKNWKPSRKISATAVGGAIGTLLVIFLPKFGVAISSNEAGLLVASLSTLVGYLIPDKSK